MGEHRLARAVAALTRISVTGSGDFFVVRNGDGLPVRVWHAHDGLRCECGQPDCDHILSLQLCGFINEPAARPEAA
jgi:hypothetical protein